MKGISFKETQIFKVIAADGALLSIRLAQPQNQIRGIVCLVHGLGDYSDCFSHLIEYFYAASFAVLAIDLHGNGGSDGGRGHIAEFETLYDDVELLLEQAKSRYPAMTLYLYGHSLGGNIVLNYSLRRKPDIFGVIASAPWLNLAGNSFFIRQIAFIGDRLKPDYIINAGIDATILSAPPLTY